MPVTALRVIETSTDEDLSLFSRYLWQQRVRHRIFEERGRQVVELADAAAAEPVRAAYAAWQDGRLVLEARRTAPRVEAADGAPDRVLALLRRFPVLAFLIGASVLIFPFSVSVADGRLSPVAGWLTIVDLRAGSPGLAGLLSGEFWRWVTPIFLHFSAVHLLFNLAVSFDLGRRIELGSGSARFAGIVVVLALVSNLGQYLVSGNPLFGGLSGVAYGMLGYVLVCRRRAPDAVVWQIHPGFAFSLVLFLVIFSTGITESFGLHVANAAHWFGFVTGGLLALLVRTRDPAS